MTYKYNPAWDIANSFSYNGSKYSLDPTVAVPVDEDHDDYGRTLQQILGLTDDFCTQVVTAEKWNQVRAYRDELLKESDWTQGDDVPSSIKTPYQTYRQSLRDITTGSDPDALTWPTKP